MNKIIQDQLNKVQNADLSNYDAENNSYLIKKRLDIKVVEDCCYLIHIKPSAFANIGVITNWNGGNKPLFTYMKVDISKRMGKMVKVTGLKHDNITGEDSSDFWSGWLCLDDLEVLKQL